MNFLKGVIALPFTFIGLMFWIDKVMPNSFFQFGNLIALVASIFSVSYSIKNKIY